jgi:hypothetical protein
MGMNMSIRVRSKAPVLVADQVILTTTPPYLPKGVRVTKKQVPVFDEFDDPFQIAYEMVTNLGVPYFVNHTDWIIYDKNGNIYRKMTNAEFAREYEAIE